MKIIRDAPIPILVSVPILSIWASTRNRVCTQMLRYLPRYWNFWSEGYSLWPAVPRGSMELASQPIRKMGGGSWRATQLPDWLQNRLQAPLWRCRAACLPDQWGNKTAGYDGPQCHKGPRSLVRGWSKVPVLASTKKKYFIARYWKNSIGASLICMYAFSYL